MSGGHNFRLPFGWRYGGCGADVAFADARAASQCAHTLLRSRVQHTHIHRSLKKKKI